MSSIRNEYYPPLLENNYYHVYNRGNNGDNLFYQPRNYDYFLRQYDAYLSNHLETYAYCLLLNHFHLLIRIRDFADIPESERTLVHGSKQLMLPEEVLSERFRRFFSCYSKSIKIQESRTGSLFEKNFRRNTSILRSILPT